MLEPEVASNSFYVFMVAIFLISSFLQEEDFRPASEVFGKGAMDLDYLNQVKPKRNCFEIYYCRVSRLTGVLSMEVAVAASRILPGNLSTKRYVFCLFSI